jgi:hypothetical protein
MEYLRPAQRQTEAVRLVARSGRDILAAGLLVELRISQVTLRPGCAAAVGPGGTRRDRGPAQLGRKLWLHHERGAMPGKRLRDPQGGRGLQQLPTRNAVQERMKPGKIDQQQRIKRNAPRQRRLGDDLDWNEQDRNPGRVCPLAGVRGDGGPAGGERTVVAAFHALFVAPTRSPRPTRAANAARLAGSSPGLLPSSAAHSDLGGQRVDQPRRRRCVAVALALGGDCLARGSAAWAETGRAGRVTLAYLLRCCVASQ